jgi:predicted DNA binding protein
LQWAADHYDEIVKLYDTDYILAAETLVYKRCAVLPGLRLDPSTEWLEVILNSSDGLKGTLLELHQEESGTHEYLEDEEIEPKKP